MNATETPIGGSLDPVVLRTVEFEILVPPVESGQETLRKKLLIQVRIEGEHEIITPESMEIIERIKMQMMISRLYDAVRKLNGYIFREAERAVASAQNEKLTDRRENNP